MGAFNQSLGLAESLIVVFFDQRIHSHGHKQCNTLENHQKSNIVDRQLATRESGRNQNQTRRIYTMEGLA